ncbi:hypothetical protein [Methylotenera sp.]|uniref:hypothetical protein n=1 Tax=Methylotenera sp. TaxID=2051956 RepID=UPI00271CB940|nr:hypothetical protein [Methylotenera sp.]MDO9204063.1 hypothetical protein [Methylotenera sp.]
MIELKTRHRLKKTPVTKIWARVWRDSVAESKRQLDCKCGTFNKCTCKRVTDYQLSRMFQPISYQGVDGTNRLRIFETISNEGNLPSDGSHPRRSFDLVDLVASTTGFQSTADVFHSPFWRLLMDPEMNITELSDLIAECINSVFPKYNSPKVVNNKCFFDDYGIPKSEDYFKTYIDELSKVYKDSLLVFPYGVFENVSLDLLALIGALFKDAYLSGALHIAVSLERAFRDLLIDFISQRWLSRENASELNKIATKIVLRSQLVGSDASFPNHLDNYQLKSGHNASISVSNFLNAHRELVWKDYLDEFTD